MLPNLITLTLHWVKICVCMCNVYSLDCWGMQFHYPPGSVLAIPARPRNIISHPHPVPAHNFPIPGFPANSANSNWTLTKPLNYWIVDN